MAVICPTVTPNNLQEYKSQYSKVSELSKRIHFDFMDGILVPTKSPDLTEIDWNEDTIADLHLMYKNPLVYLDMVIKLKPNLVIVHADAEGNFGEIAQILHDANIKVGVALLPNDLPEVIKPAINYIDHVLIFSGKLGYFGGVMDIKLLYKVAYIKNLKSDIEIGWDGGINSNNINELVRGNVDVLNVGGFIHNSDNAATAYAKLKLLVDGE